MTTEASLKLGVDSTEVKTAEKALADLAKTGSTAEQATKNLGDEAKKAAAASTQMSTGFSGATSSIKNLVGAYVSFQAVKSVLTGVITTTAEFSQSIANLSAITGASGKDLEFYAEQAREIGRSTTISASQAAEGFKLIASAKPDLLASAEALAEVTNQAVILSEATGSTLAESASALGSALNQFQLPATDASRVINALAASSKFGTAEVGAVTEAMRNAGSAANSLGLDFEETVAGIQALAASGRQGADAGTALRQVLLKLESTGNDNLQPSLVGLVGALDELKSMNLDNTQLMDLFGQEAFTAATSLLAQSDVAKELNVSLRGTNTAVEQASINMNTLSADYLKAQNAAQDLQIAFGEKLEPSLRNVTQRFADVTESITNFVESEDFSKWADRAGTTVEILATVIGARLVASVSASAGAFLIATQQSLAYQAALARMAGVSATAAISQTALASAISLAGGWVGVAVLASAAVYKLVDAYMDHNKAAQEVETAIFLAQNGIHLAGKEFEDIVVKIDLATKSLRDYVEAGGALSGMIENSRQEAAQRARDAIAARNATDASTDSIVENTVRTKEQIAELRKSAVALDHGAFSTAKKTEAVHALIDSLSQVRLSYSENIAKMNETTFVMQGVTAATEGLAAASEDTSEVMTEASRAATESWGRTHEYLTNAFIDISNDGGSAFEKIADSAVQSVKRIIAEWLAMKAMVMLGIPVPASIGGSVGSSAVGSVASSAAQSAIGSAVVGSAAGQFVAGAAGTATGIAAGTMGPPTAAAAAGAGSMATITALATNPATIAIAAALALAYAAKNDFFKDPDNYQRSFAGLLTAPTTGAQGSTFEVDPFASGFRATGIARNASQETAMAQIDVFRQLDAAGAELVKKLGGVVDLSMATLAGVGQEGTAGTAGTFLGTGGMTTAADIAAMTDLYMTQFADHITGLDAELLKAVQSAGSAEEVMKLLTDSVAEISDTAKTSAAELTHMEQARKSASESVLAAYNSGLSELDSIEKAYEAFQKYAERGLTAEHISDFTGLMESEINAVIARGAARIQSVMTSADFSTPVTSPFQQSIRDALANPTRDNSYAGFMGPQSFNLPEVAPLIPLNGSFANGVDYVGFDGPAMLHRGEKVTSVAERNSDAISSRRMAAEMSELRQEIREQKVYNRRTFEILDRWAGSNFTVIV